MQRVLIHQDRIPQAHPAIIAQYVNQLIAPVFSKKKHADLRWHVKG